jgi:hypothetical protein
MFASLANFRALGRRRHAAAAMGLAHSNDNRPDDRRAAPPRRTRGPVLTCDWHPTGNGRRLECRWRIGRDDERADDAPRQPAKVAIEAAPYRADERPGAPNPQTPRCRDPLVVARLC